jgi:hypothetical protein
VVRTMLMLLAGFFLTTVAFGQARPIKIYLMDEDAHDETAGHEVFNGLSARIRGTNRFKVLTNPLESVGAQVVVDVNCAEKPFESFCNVQVSFRETSSGLTEDLSGFLTYGGTSEDSVERAFQGFMDATTDDKIIEMRHRIKERVRAYCSEPANYLECQGYGRK